jgi:hypothetical protein
MHGLSDKATAQSKAVELAQRNPTNRYEVSAHRYSDNTWVGGPSTPLTWGVVCYAPYCDAMPWRCLGFVWF